LLIFPTNPLTEMLSAVTGPFGSMTSTLNCSIVGKVAFAQPLQKVISEKHSPVYSLYNGAQGEVSINLDKDLVTKVGSVTGFDQTPPGQIFGMVYRMFKKFEVEIATDDVTKLPPNLQNALGKSDLIHTAIAPFLGMV
jgi:hypothetical protein